MFLTRRFEYAMKGIFYLAFVQPNEYVQVRTISQKTAVPKRFLEQIFLALREQGILRSRRGSRGGYTLSVSPEKLNLYQLFTILEEKNLFSDPPPLKGCGEERYLWNLRNELIKALEGITLKRLLTSEIEEYLRRGANIKPIYYI
jgi:Rrf2 family protein